MPLRLTHTLAPLRPILDNPRVTEVCINRPQEVFIQSYDGWSSERLPFADFYWCRDFAKLVGSATKQRVDEVTPILSATLPTAERVQFVLPPATLAQRVSITIRRPSTKVRTLDELAAGGLFAQCLDASEELDPGEKELLALKARREYAEFIRLAVQLRKNIVVSGSTGTGKTTTSNALILEVPAGERLITIEDAEELVLERHPNSVRLLYSKGAQGLAKVTPKTLLESCLRMRPDRVFLSELRGEEAFDYLAGDCGAPRFDHEYSRLHRALGLGANHAARQAVRGRTVLADGGCVESFVLLGRCGDAVWFRRQESIRQGGLV